MIRLPGRFIWLAQPRAASRSISAVLMKQCGGEDLAFSHHARRHHVTRLKEYSEPVISMIRDPYKVLMSRYAYAIRNIGQFNKSGVLQAGGNVPEVFRAWFDWYKPDGHVGFGDHIAQYHEFVDHYYVFERSLLAFFDAVGLPHIKQIPEIGRDETGPRPNIADLDPVCKQLIDRRFSFDVKLYQEVASREPHVIT